MRTTLLPQHLLSALLENAAQRDRATARRVCLAQILWQERYLTRPQLITRLEGQLGRGCFGASAWKDAFYRDMRVVKAALAAAGYRLCFSRSPTRPGYYLYAQPAIDAVLAKTLDGSVAEVDAAQIAVLKSLAVGERFRLGCSISEAARTVVAHRILQRNPQLPQAEAYRLALAGQE